MKKKVEYMLAYHDQCVVEKIVTFETAEEFILHVVQYIPDAIHLRTMKEIIELLHKTWNYVDGNEWKMPYKIGVDGIARIMFRPK